MASRDDEDDVIYEEAREQDRYLPVANIARIMKRALPKNAKIAKEAKEAVQECVSEFISFVTGEASDKCIHEKRKTLNGDDFLWAMSTLGFERYLEPLEIYLAKYRESVRGERQQVLPPAGVVGPLDEPLGRKKSWTTASATDTTSADAGNQAVRIPKEVVLPPGARVLPIGSQVGDQLVKNGGTVMMLKPNGSGGFIAVPTNIAAQVTSRRQLPPSEKLEEGDEKDKAKKDGNTRKRSRR